MYHIFREDGQRVTWVIANSCYSPAWPPLCSVWASRLGTHTILHYNMRAYNMSEGRVIKNPSHQDKADFTSLSGGNTSWTDDGRRLTCQTEQGRKEGVDGFSRQLVTAAQAGLSKSTRPNRKSIQFCLPFPPRKHERQRSWRKIRRVWVRGLSF